MKTLLFPIFAFVALLLTSCDHKDLCYVHPHTTKLKVVYDWTEAPEASPVGMCVFFYSIEESSRYHRFDFKGMDGGEIELPAGHYRIITYNNDTELVQFSSTQSFDSHYAYTRTGDILEPMYGNGVATTARADNDERVVITPDGLWGCSAVDIEIDASGESYIHEKYGSRAMVSVEKTKDEAGNQIVTMRPHDMLCHYSYEVRNVKNANHITRISGALSGMSGTMNLSTENVGAENVTLPVPGQVNASTNTVTGAFLTFGHSDANTAPHKMSFYVVMDDGTKYSFKDAQNLDVTTQVNTAPNPRRVHIIIDGLDVPTPMGNSEGFKPSVDDWEVINQELHV